MTDDIKITCPYDKIEIQPQPFGYGYVWICPICGIVIKSIAVTTGREK
jgi:hypothetical protein